MGLELTLREVAQGGTAAAAGSEPSKKKMKKACAGGGGGKAGKSAGGGSAGGKGKGGSGQQCLVEKWPVNQSWNAFQAAHRGRQMTPQDWKSAKAALAASSMLPAPAPAVSASQHAGGSHAMAAGGSAVGAGAGGARDGGGRGGFVSAAGIFIDDFFCAASAAE